MDPAVVLPGLVAGALLGAVLQRGQLCLHAASRGALEAAPAWRRGGSWASPSVRWASPCSCCCPGPTG